LYSVCVLFSARWNATNICLSSPLIDRKRTELEEKRILEEKYDCSGIKPVPYRKMDFGDTSDKQPEDITFNEAIFIKRRPPKKKKIEALTEADHEVVVVEPRDNLPTVKQFLSNQRSGLLYGVSDEKHLILYRIENFELADLT